jgi:hypothetical protein
MDDSALLADAKFVVPQIAMASTHVFDQQTALPHGPPQANYRAGIAGP